MKYLIVFLFMISLAFGQNALIISKQAGQNYFNHSNTGVIIDSVYSILTQDGYNVTITNNYVSESNSDYCMIFNINSSGSGFVESSAEEIWWSTIPAGVQVLHFHSSAGDCERNTYTGAPGNIWNNFSANFVKASLPNNNKHSWQSNTVDVFFTLNGSNLIQGNLPNTFTIQDEIYHVSEQQFANNNSYFNNQGTRILARADYDGPFVNGTQIPILWDSYHNGIHNISLTIGHKSDILDPLDYRRELLDNIIFWMESECPIVFALEDEDLLEEPVTTEGPIIYHWFTIDGKDLGWSEKPPVANRLLIRKHLSTFKKIYYAD